MSPAVGRRDIFDDSHAWQRLHEPLTEEVPIEIRRRFHDVTNVFQSMLAATAELQHASATADERITRNESRHDELLAKLFDPESGAFVRVRDYVDGRLGKLSAVAWTIVGGLVVGLAMLVFQVASG